MEPIKADDVRDALSEVLGNVSHTTFETIVQVVVDIANASLRNAR